MGVLLSLLGVFLLQPDRCDVVVNDVLEASEPLRLAQLYREGKRDEALRLFEALPDGAVDRMIERVIEVRELSLKGRGETLGPEDSCLQAVSLLETELAMMLALRSEWEESDAHFDPGWRVSFLIDRYALQERYQRDWLLAAGLFHHELVFVEPIEADELPGNPTEAFWRAERFFDHAVKRYPEDPEILLAAGALVEWSGSLRYGFESHLKEAETLYARTLALAPNDREALLRYGWVLRKLGRNEEAVKPLVRLLSLEGEDSRSYRSHMALGRIAEAAGKLEEAMEHYEAARRILPSWQVAHVALSHSLHASGEHDRARRILEAGLALKGTEEVLLGWWSYELGLAPRFEGLFRRMRAEVSR